MDEPMATAAGIAVASATAADTLPAADGVSHHIAVLGGGPAGAATAIGLRRFGYAVTLFCVPRRFAAVEGVSGRVADGLRHAGLHAALATLAPPSPRRAHWRGTDNAANTERLVDRPRFDAALLDDVRRAGVEVVCARVLAWSEEGEGVRVVYQREGVPDGAPAGLGASVTPAPPSVCQADFVVEARGRAAPQVAGRVRGAETVSLLQYWQPVTGDGAAAPASVAPYSAVQSFEDGWAWLAQGDDGRRYLQLTLDVATAGLPPKAGLAAFCTARLAALPAAQAFMAGAVPLGVPYARTSTPVLAAEVAGARWLRVGDAAMAVDPLSGNGIFQALSSALQAPAVIHTLLRFPARAALARTFHRQRIEHLFFRFARIGRDFYAGEDRWPTQPFWQARRGWPDAEPLHGEVTPDSVVLARRPVLHDGEIVDAEVVVTPDQPLGVWRLDGIELAPLLRAVRAEPGRDARQVLAARLGARGAALAAWLAGQGWIAATDAVEGAPVKEGGASYAAR